MNISLHSGAINRVPEEVGLIDPEAYDASEQHFAANPGSNLEKTGPGLVTENDLTGNHLFANNLSGKSDQSKAPVAQSHIAEEVSHESPTSAPAASPVNAAAPDPDAWRQEVAKRLNSYRARRQPRQPRYPSLQLKFEPSEPTKTASSFSGESHLILNGSAAQVAPREYTAEEPRGIEAPAYCPPPETTARVIPFRRSTSAPPKPLEELAEPLQLFPRILEVPEVTPPLPALGGILIESEEEEPNPKRPGIEIPLQTSPISRRFLAVGLDGMVVASALALFAYVFFRITAFIPPLKQSAPMGAVMLAILWAGYQYLLLTYTGSTPGLKLTKLTLNQFDGEPVPRRIRRWRALASVLSAASIGLGYAWCMLDEDQLCWHDRITRTHLASTR